MRSIVIELIKRKFSGDILTEQVGNYLDINELLCNIMFCAPRPFEEFCAANSLTLVKLSTNWYKIVF